MSLSIVYVLYSSARSSSVVQQSQKLG
jgi:hypothetical protein